MNHCLKNHRYKSVATFRATIVDQAGFAYRADAVGRAPKLMIDSCRCYHIIFTMTQGIYMFKHRSYTSYVTDDGNSHLEVFDSYVIGWSQDIDNVDGDITYSTYLNKSIDTCHCTLACRRYHMILDLLDKDGAPVDPKYNDPRVRSVNVGEDWQLGMIKDRIDQVLSLSDFEVMCNKQIE